jgi:hypothetical protein
VPEPHTRYQDLGSGFYDKRTGLDRKKRNHVRQLEALGYKVTLEPAAKPTEFPLPASPRSHAEPAVAFAGRRLISD